MSFIRTEGINDSIFEISSGVSENLATFLAPFVKAGSPTKLLTGINPDYESFADLQIFLADSFKKIIPWFSVDALGGLKSGMTQCMMIKGFPVGVAPPTPRFEDRFKPPTPNMGDYINLGLTCLANRGKPLKLKPADFANLIRNNSTKNPRLANLEPAHSHPENDFVMLFCLRGENNAKASYINSDLLYEGETTENRALLQEPFLKDKMGNTYPIIEHDGRLAKFSYQFAASVTHKVLSEYIEQTDKDDKYAKLCEHLIQKFQSKQHFEATYQPGDFIAWNQRTTIRYSDRYEQTPNPQDKRWAVLITVPENTETISSSKTPDSIVPEELLNKISISNRLSRQH